MLVCLFGIYWSLNGYSIRRSFLSRIPLSFARLDVYHESLLFIWCSVFIWVTFIRITFDLIINSALNESLYIIFSKLRNWFDSFCDLKMWKFIVFYTNHLLNRIGFDFYHQTFLSTESFVLLKFQMIPGTIIDLKINWMFSIFTEIRKRCSYLLRLQTNSSWPILRISWHTIFYKLFIKFLMGPDVKFSHPFRIRQIQKYSISVKMTIQDKMSTPIYLMSFLLSSFSLFLVFPYFL